MPSERTRKLPQLPAKWRWIAVAIVGIAMPLGLLVLSYLLGAQAAAPTLCTFSNSKMLAESILAKKSTARLQQLTNQVQAQLASDRKSLTADMGASKKVGKSLGAADRQSRQEALQRRQDELQRKSKQLDARIRYTRDQVTQAVDKRFNEAVEAAYANHGCSILLNRDVVLNGNPHNDLTPDVIKALNSESNTITFGLLSLPKPSANVPRPIESVPAEDASPERSGSQSEAQDPGRAEGDRGVARTQSPQSAADTGLNGKREDILDAVREWARSWAEQDLPGYLASYSQHFEPEDGASRGAWARERRQRVTAPRGIELKLTDISLEMQGGRALVRFLQRYNSGNYSDEGRKALLLTREQGRWKILREAEYRTNKRPFPSR